MNKIWISRLKSVDVLFSNLLIDPKKINVNISCRFITSQAKQMFILLRKEFQANSNLKAYAYPAERDLYSAFSLCIACHFL